MVIDPTRIQFISCFGILVKSKVLSQIVSINISIPRFFPIKAQKTFNTFANFLVFYITLELVESELFFYVFTMPIRLTQVDSLGYDPAYVRLPSDSVGISVSLP